MPEIRSYDAPLAFTKEWKFQTGDDPGWARSDFDDSHWKPIDITRWWGRQEFSGYTGFGWYRLTIKVPVKTPDDYEHNPLGLALGYTHYASYEVFAGGQKIGGFGSLPPAAQTPLTQARTYRLPAKAIAADGKLVIAVRCWQNPNYGKYFPRLGGFNGDVSGLGSLQVLEDRIEVEDYELKFDYLLRLILIVVFVLMALYHLQLYRRRRQQVEYFWFAVFTLGFSGNIFFASPWSNVVFSPLVSQVGLLCGANVAVIGCIQFLWPFLSQPIGNWLQAYQWLQIVLFALLIVAPQLAFSTWPFLLAVGPLLPFSLWMIVREAWRGQTEARTLLWGSLALIVVEGIEITRVVWHVPIPELSDWGFAAFVLSMAASLSNRFSRVHSELDRLNQDLEEKVIDRTAQLDKKNEQLSGKITELAQKNEELIRSKEEILQSQQRVDRIFDALSDALAGTVLEGKYRLDEKIGSGGFGAVFRGMHLTMKRPIAIKVFRPISGNATTESLERFQMEAVSTCRINHPNAVAVLDSGISESGIAYLVMELLEGHSLSQELHDQGVCTVARCAQIIIPVCDALAKAHSVGIIHRDIKPDNVFLHHDDEGEIVKVVDFGIAKLVGETHDLEIQNLTQVGHIIGTPTYMSPERLDNKLYDGRADVYSVGVMMYQMLTGRVPFESTSGMMGLIFQHLMKEPSQVHELASWVSPEFSRVIGRALVKDPNARPSAKELMQELIKVTGIGYHAHTPESGHQSIRNRKIMADMETTEIPRARIMGSDNPVPQDAMTVAYTQDRELPNTRETLNTEFENDQTNQ